MNYCVGHGGKKPFIDHTIDEPNTGCRIWIGGRNKQGYGVYAIKRKSYGAYRVAFELDNGPIPPGLVIDHLCRNVACVNPRHMEIVTQKENVMRGVGITSQNKKKENCPRCGTALTPRTSPSGRGWRQCLKCKKESDRRGKIRRRTAFTICDGVK